MKDRLILGRYIPVNSVLHQLDPRLKIATAIIYISILSFVSSWISLLILILFAWIAVLLSNISVSYYLSGIRPMLTLIIFTALLQILFFAGGDIIFSWGPISISIEGIYRAIIIFIRFTFIIIISTILTVTTQPIALTDAFEFFLSPLKRLGYPVADTAIMLSIALRFVPTMFEEADRISHAQRSRGVDFNSGTTVQKIKSYLPILLPLFVSSYDRAPQLATAMEIRGYRGGQHRTKYREFHWSTLDTKFLIGILIVFITIIFIEQK